MPGSGQPTVPTGSNLLLQLPFPVCACRCYILSPHTYTPVSNISRMSVSVAQGLQLCQDPGSLGSLTILFVPSLLLFVSTRRPCCVSWIIHVAEQREMSSQPLPIIDGSLLNSHDFDNNQASVILK